MLKLLRVIMIALCFLGTFNIVAQNRGSTADAYDPISGEPKCRDCHSGQKKPAIDYTQNAVCLGCHNADYSQRFLAIDQRYKVSIAEVTHSYRQLSQAVQLQSISPSKTQDANNQFPKNLNIPDGMVYVPNGLFIMGTDDWWPKSSPSHKRMLAAFFIDKYEVTNQRYLAFIKATQTTESKHWPKHWPKKWMGGIAPDKAEHPVANVDWFSANKYCQWQGARLPTEAEWEKAARGTQGRVFPWGNAFDKNKANTPQFGHGDSMPVGQFEQGVSPFGVYDMAGNVFEWTADWYKAYPGNKHKDPNEGELYRVVRGGSWYDCTFYKCGISSPTFNRIFFNPHTKNSTFGFRCAKSVN